jgi:hypothetical protein
MSAYSTITITRQEAENMVRAAREKRNRSVQLLSNEELDQELHEYVYSENYTDIVGVLYNYNITP